MRVCSATALAALLWAVAASWGWAGKVVLQIRAGNPNESRPQPVTIRSNLPAGVTPEDLLDTDGLKVGYDVKNDVYYVYKEEILAPKETRLYRVQIRDRWRLDPEQLQALRTRAARLADMLRGRADYHPLAVQLRDQIEKQVDLILRYQEQNDLSAGVRPLQHIAAFEANQKTLSLVKRDLGRLENLILASGQDPGELIGEVTPPRRPRGEVEHPPSEYRIVINRITVRNQSPSETRKVALRRDLPPEIKAYDVLDGGGLEVATDPRTDTCYVFKNDLVLAPQETITFDVKIRDKWNVHRPRMESLLATARDIQARLGARAQVEAVRKALTETIAELEALLQEQGPTELNEEYVAFYRRQAARVDALAERLARIEAILRPVDRTTRFGFRPKPPTEKTTWLIIWFILGFLLVLSLLFFFRWYGRTRAETMSAHGGAALPPRPGTPPSKPSA